MSSLESRRYKTGDEFGIVSLYNHITGRHRTLEQHRWEWLNTPEGTGSIWVIMDSGSREIVGHHGLIPISMDFFGSKLLAGKTENTILHEKYMGTGIYFLYEKRFLQEAKNKFDCFFTNFAIGTPAKIRRKLGYKPIGTYANFIMIPNPKGWKALVNYLLKRNQSKYLMNVLVQPVLTMGGILLSLLFQKKCKIDKNITFHTIKNLWSIEQEFDAFCQRLKGTLGITIHRSFKYLQWRIFDNPYGSYDFLLARNQGEIVGYIITQTLKEPIQQGVVVDLVYTQPNEIIFNTLLSQAVKRLKESDVSMINFPTLESKNFLNTCILKNGFIPMHRFRKFLSRFVKRFQEDQTLLVNMNNQLLILPKVFQPYHWYYTHLFTEGIQ